jgi:hypothetical protein
MYFGAWEQNAAPRWGEHWGCDWEQRRNGWDRRDGRAAPAPAPLPVYQRRYSGNRYPKMEEQHAIQSRNYRYQPEDARVCEQIQRTQGERAQSARELQPMPGRKNSAHDARVQQFGSSIPPAQKKSEPAGQQQQRPPFIAATLSKQEAAKSQRQEIESRSKDDASERAGNSNRRPDKAREKDQKRGKESNR